MPNSSLPEEQISTSNNFDLKKAVETPRVACIAELIVIFSSSLRFLNLLELIFGYLKCVYGFSPQPV